MTKLFQGIVLGMLMLLGGSCANRLVLPPIIQLIRSDKKTTEFPFELICEASSHIRFNVHTLSPAYENVPTTFIAFLKKDSGALTTGDFFIGSLGMHSPMATRGAVRFSGEQVTINAEIAIGNEPARGWIPSSINGTYRVMRKEPNHSSQPTTGLAPGRG